MRSFSKKITNWDVHKVPFSTEITSNIDRVDTYLRGFELSGLSHLAPKAKWCFVVYPHLCPARVINLYKAAMWLHKPLVNPGCQKIVFEDHVCFGKSLRDVPFLKDCSDKSIGGLFHLLWKANVLVDPVVDDRSTWVRRFDWVEDCGEFFVLHLNQV